MTMSNGDQGKVNMKLDADFMLMQCAINKLVKIVESMPAWGSIRAKEVIRHPFFLNYFFQTESLPTENDNVYTLTIRPNSQFDQLLKALETRDTQKLNDLEALMKQRSRMTELDPKDCILKLSPCSQSVFVSRSQNDGYHHWEIFRLDELPNDAVSAEQLKALLAEKNLGWAVNGDITITSDNFDTGGIDDGEVPAVLQKGEGVFTKAQMKKLTPAFSDEQIEAIEARLIERMLRGGGLRPEVEKLVSKHFSHINFTGFCQEYARRNR